MKKKKLLLNVYITNSSKQQQHIDAVRHIYHSKLFTHNYDFFLETTFSQTLILLLQTFWEMSFS